jgi:mannose PTS system EIID component
MQNGMQQADLFKLFIRSLFIQASLNFRGMQNLGFAFAMVPVARLYAHDKKRAADLLTRHLQSFNTHPYLAGSIIGSVVHIEERLDGESDAAEANTLKNVLMGPYAAIGDSFFWGALKPFAAIFGVLVAVQGFLLAPVIFLLLYTPPHVWIRVKGFLEGYRKGKQGIDFIRMLDMPGIARKLRFISLIVLGILAAMVSETMCRSLTSLGRDIPLKLAALIVTIVLYQLIRKGVPTLGILYGMFILFCVISL